MENKILFQIRRKSIGKNSVDKILELINPVIIKNVQVKSITCPYTNEGIINKLRNIIWISKYRNEYVHFAGDLGYLSIFRKRKSYLITILDLGMPGKYTGFKKFILDHIWYKQAVRRSFKSIAISEFTKRSICELFSHPNNIETKIQTIGCPVNLSLEAAERDMRFPIDQNSKLKVLQIATSQHNKNISNSISALIGKNVEYHFVGLLKKEDEILLKKNFINYQVYKNISEELLRCLYKTCHLLLFPSLYEGFGMPIIEAQAHNCLVLTSNISPMKEVAGDGAILVNPYSIDSISKGIDQIISLPEIQEKLREKGNKNSRKYTPEIIGGMYIKEYKRFLNGK